MLNNSSHRCIMITGDNALTALHVAEEVEIVKRETLILDVREGIKGLSWESSDESSFFPFSPTLSPSLPNDLCQLKKLFDYDLCVTGRALERIHDFEVYKFLLARIWIYARVSPSQKELILTALNAQGYQTLMCGDGTNDVGALKQAHVGIALLDGKMEDMIKLAAQAQERRRKHVLQQRVELEKRWGIKKPIQESNMSIPKGKNSSSNQSRSQVIKSQSFDKSMGKMMESLETLDDEVPSIKFGDASVAAPFTSKLSTVMSGNMIIYDCFSFTFFLSLSLSFFFVLSFPLASGFLFLSKFYTVFTHRLFV